MTEKFVDLDVRPALRAGEEPFEQIMAVVTTLPAGQGLRLFATFKPTPLLHVLGSKGFTHELKELEGGEWEVLFTPPATSVAPAEADILPAPAGGVWPDPAFALEYQGAGQPQN